VKPIRLEMYAFGPFAAKAVVDFAAIGRGLFLIAGDTGSGKTTIFDALVYALYGEKSGQDNPGTPSTLKSDYAAADVKPYVDLTFELQGATYRILRTVPYMRPKLRGEGTTPEQMSVILTLPDGREIVGEREVAGQINERLGLDSAQFRHLFLLPQGEFSKVLNAKSADREAIFRKVFRTDFAKRVQDKLRAVYNEKQEALNEMTVRLHDAAQDLPVTKDLSFSEPFLNAVRNRQIDAIFSFEKEIRAAAEEAEMRLAKDLAAEKRLQEASRLLTSEMEAAIRINRQLTRIADLEEKKARLAKEKDDVDRARQKKRTAERARTKIKPLEQTYLRLKTGVEAETATKAELLEAITANDKVLTTLADSWRAFTERQPERDKWQKEKQRLEEAKLVWTEMTDLSDTLKKKRSEHEQRANQKNKLDALITASLELEKDKEQIEKDNRQKELAEAVHGQAAVELQKKAEMIDVFFSLLAERRQRFSAMSAAETELKDVQTKRHAYKQSYMNNQAGLLAAELEAGEPCPVCGSKEHPLPASCPEDAVTLEMLDQTEALVDDALAKVRSLTNTYISCDTETARVLADLHESKAIQKDLTLDTDENRWSACEADLRAGIIAEKDAWRAEDAELKEARQQAIARLQELQKAKDERVKAEQERDILAETILTIKMEMATLDGRIKAKQTQLVGDSLEEVETRLRQIEQSISEADGQETTLRDQLVEAKERQADLTGRLELVSKQLGRLIVERTEAKEALDQGLAAEAFDSLEHYRDSLLDAAEEERLEQIIKAHADAVLQTESELKALLPDVEGKAYVDLALLEEKKESLRNDIEQLEGQLEHLRQVAFSWKDAIDRLFSERDAYTDLVQETGEAQALFHVANGTYSGAARRTFEAYVQAAWFDEVLNAANVRLNTLSAGRYSLLLREIPTSRAVRTGLDLDVMDRQTGRSRPAESLSGGETFMASLALALGLSDVVQAATGGVAVDCLFVDEGFGSLDQASLHQALNVLNELAGDSRMIGIISHVTELKTVIMRQLLVEKGQQGSRLRWRDES